MSQNLDALAKGNAIRLARADWKRKVKADPQICPALIVDTPECLLRMKAIDLISAMSRWGRIRALKALKYADIPETKTIGDLTKRQALSLSTELGMNERQRLRRRG